MITALVEKKITPAAANKKADRLLDLILNLSMNVEISVPYMKETEFVVNHK